MYTLYHNPKCSKSRAALALLQQSNQPFKAIEYLETPLTKSQLSQIINALDSTAETLIRTTDEDFKALEVNDIKKLTPQQIINILFQSPKLMQRPILTYQNKAVIGRPTEKIANFISSNA